MEVFYSCLRFAAGGLGIDLYTEIKLLRDALSCMYVQTSILGDRSQQRMETDPGFSADFFQQ